MAANACSSLSCLVLEVGAQVHPRVEMGNLAGVAIEGECPSPTGLADALLGRLAPAGMIDVRVHIGVKPVFIGRTLVPSRGRERGDQLDFHNGLDALESVLPRHDQ